MLGVNDPSQRWFMPYRNYAAVRPGDPEFVELARLGMVERFDGTFLSRDHWYQCTPAGIEAARKSFRKFRLPKSKRRYQAFLDLRDVLPDLTFHEYLTTPDFAESRAEA